MPISLPSSADFEIYKYLPSRFQSAPKSPLSEPRILTSSTWTYTGAPLDPDALPPSYHTWSRGTFDSGDILALLMPFLTFIHNFMKETHMTHYCLSIRAQKANSDFVQPRWHVDRRFFDADLFEKGMKRDGKHHERRMEENPSNWKIATALIGPGTLFLKDGRRARQLQKEIEDRKNAEKRKKGHYAVDEKHVCTSFRCLGCADMAESVRVDLARAVKGMEIVEIGKGELVVFKVDGYNSSHGEPAMHSEPDMSDGDRLFVHVVPGREKELRRLVEAWGMEFPRDWSVGVLHDWEL